jgi:hypothetical protein
MTWKSLASPLAIKSRRRVVAPAVFYGLSLAVRFTSAAGEEVEVAPHFMQTPRPLVSMMTRAGSGLPYQDWSPKGSAPAAFRYGWQLSSLSRCIAP